VTGLVWAGCLSPAEAARIAALRGRVLRGCVARPAAMARVHVDVDLARRLITAHGQPSSGLHIAAYETATSHLLAGPASAIRDLARRGAEIGVPVDVLPVVGAMHSPAIADCAAPLRSVLAATAFQPPRRGLISTVTGQPVTTDHDAADLLAEQITRPVLFAQAMALAAERANLVVVAGPGGDPASGPGNSAEPSLAALATAASGIPAIQLPHVADVPTIAALFTAGALKELSPLIANSLSKDTSYPIDAQSSWTVPRARNGMADDGAAGNGVYSHNGAGREATAKSAERALAERISRCAGAP
jgi:enediyne polyketide synthase